MTPPSPDVSSRPTDRARVAAMVARHNLPDVAALVRTIRARVFAGCPIDRTRVPAGPPAAR